jgi:hypothetical protein
VYGGDPNSSLFEKEEVDKAWAMTVEDLRAEIENLN